MIDRIYLHLQLNYENSEEAEEAKKEIKEVFKEKADLLTKLDVSLKDVMIKRKHYMVMIAIPYNNAMEKIEAFFGKNTETSKEKGISALENYTNFIDEFVDSVTPPCGVEISFWWKMQSD